MFRTFTFVAVALGLVVTGSAATPAAAFPSPAFVNHMEQPLAHFHAVNSPGRSMWKPPSKKRPL